MDLENFSSELDGWRAYNESAALFLKEAADAGEPRAVSRLAAEYSGTAPALGGTHRFEQDAYQAAKYLIAAQAFPDYKDARFVVSLLERAKRSLTADQLENARLEAETLVLSWPPDRLRALDNKSSRPGLPTDGADCEE